MEDERRAVEAKAEEEMEAHPTPLSLTLVYVVCLVIYDSE